jgi:hypothetical protein
VGKRSERRRAPHLQRPQLHGLRTSPSRPTDPAGGPVFVPYASSGWASNYRIQFGCGQYACQSHFAFCSATRPADHELRRKSASAPAKANLRKARVFSARVQIIHRGPINRKKNRPRGRGIFPVSSASPIAPRTDAAVVPSVAGPVTVMPIVAVPIPAVPPMSVAWTDLHHNGGR